MHEIIPQIRSIINQTPIFLILLVFFTLTAFFMGRSLKFIENRPAFYFETKTFEAEKQNFFNNFQTTPSPSLTGGERVHQVVASKGGKKYYFVWCKGAENIKEKNKRYFADESAAQKAGYTKAASCK